MAGIYSAKVLKGVILLHEKRPEWYREVNLETLDLADGLYCVLGQVFGSYGEGLHAVFGSMTSGQAKSHGYTLGASESDWSGLTDEWKRVIRDFQQQQEPLAPWERELLEGNIYTAADMAAGRESAVAQGRADGITAYRQALDKVANAADSCGISLTFADVVALTDALDLL